MNTIAKHSLYINYNLAFFMLTKSYQSSLWPVIFYKGRLLLEQELHLIPKLYSSLTIEANQKKVWHQFKSLPDWEHSLPSQKLDCKLICSLSNWVHWGISSANQSQECHYHKQNTITIVLTHCFFMQSHSYRHLPPLFFTEILWSLCGALPHKEVID